MRCPLSETRNQVVFGAGNADADLMFVGEAPGAEEDRQGLPFVGRAGRAPDRAAGGDRAVARGRLHRQRPQVPAARQPRPAAGRDRVLPALPVRAGELIEPRVVCTLGNFATKLLTGNPTGITRVRGTPQVHELGGGTVFLLPLFHPAAALRTPAVAETLRGDFEAIPELLAAAAARRAGAGAGGPAASRPRPASRRPDQLGLFG